MNTTHKQNESKLTKVAVVVKDEQNNNGWIHCCIGRDIVFQTNGLESYCFANWEPIVFDVFVLAAVVDFCDRIIRRPSLGWGRNFRIRLPVHDPDRWRGTTSEKLGDALSFVTGDQWHFEFKHGVSEAKEPSQLNLEIPSPSALVLPFSDGLDSRIVSALTEQKQGVELVRVRLGVGNAKHAKTRSSKEPFAVVPYKVKSSASKFREPSARARGFKFALLSGVAAYLCKASEVILPESGQGALGPSLVPVGQAYVDYRNHPRFTVKMTEFLECLLRHHVRYTFPRLWQTKGETLREFAGIVGGEWSDTRSCWKPSWQTSVNHKRRQCGVCAACMLRRMSVHAAGLVERPETYVWEDLSAGTFEKGASESITKKSFNKSDKDYAIAGVLHLDHLADLPGSQLHAESIRRESCQIASALGISSQDVERKLARLLNQHRLEWECFIASLGEKSFVTKWIPRRNNHAS
jgi:hypothetical protein